MKVPIGSEPLPAEIPPTGPDWLECPHCNDVAIESDEEGYFTDQSGGACVSCGFPGHVSMGADTDPWWNESTALDAVCTKPGCDKCDPQPAPEPGPEGEP